MSIAEYRKKPLVVRALQHTGDDAFFGALANFTDVEFRYKVGALGPTDLEIFNPGSSTWRQVSPGDYIIIAPTGCRYPVLADQFERNYDALPEPPDAVV